MKKKQVFYEKFCKEWDVYKEGGRIEQRDTLNYESHNSNIRQNLSHEESCNWKQTSNWKKKVFCSLFVLFSDSEKTFPIEKWSVCI